jgi:RNA polymerase sigma-70 factor, ECF subfamily
LEFSLPISDLEQAAMEAAEQSMVMDEQEFRLLYERTSKPLWAYLSRSSRDASLADDLLQEVYHRFLRAKPPEMDAQGQKNYLFRIATNLLRDRARAAKPEIELTDVDSGERAGARIEAKTDLRRALEYMGERERQILWMAYAEGFSHREIAGVIGVKEKSVRPLLHRAKTKLADVLQRGRINKPLSGKQTER